MTLNVVHQFIALHDSVSQKLGYLTESWNELCDELNSILEDANNAIAFAGEPGPTNPKSYLAEALNELNGLIEDNADFTIESFKIFTDMVMIGDSQQEVESKLKNSEALDVREYVKKYG